ncbi:MAG: ferrochelatase, partial [Balneolales bacterium]
MSKDPKKIGIVLMNMGGPTSVEGVRHFLENLFGDQDIINLKGGKVQERLAKTIAKYRYKGVSEKYREINGCPNGCSGSKYCTNRQEKVVSDCCSPINSLTELQRRTLEKQLKSSWPDQFVKVYTAMRYWLPFDYEVIKEIYDDGIGHLVLLPLYPQFSYTTSGSSFRNWEKIRQEQEQPAPWEEYIINEYHLNKNYLASLNDRIDEGLKTHFSESERNKVHLVFTAHGTPISEIEKGDPYTRHIRETVKGVMDLRDQKESYWLSYQSRVGPSKWTQPNTEKLVFRLLDYGVKYLLMVPVAFVTDHIETLHELNIELREEIQGRDYRKLAITKGLNDHPLFMQALQDEITLKLNHVLPKQ